MADPHNTAAVYDYLDAKGVPILRVEREPEGASSYMAPAANKRWEQVDMATHLRRSDIELLYRLPDLLQAPPEDNVYFVQEERQADELAALGKIATATCVSLGMPNQLPFRRFSGRSVTVLHVDTKDGRAWAVMASRQIKALASGVTLKRVALAESQGIAELFKEQTDRTKAPDDSGAALDDDGDPLYEGNSNWEIAQKIMHQGLKLKGKFLVADGVEYYSDAKSRLLSSIDGRAMKLLLSRRHRVNPQEGLYKYLVEEMRAEAQVSGERALVRKFAYYDEARNYLYVDQGAGRVLRLDGKAVTEIRNGDEGVLFTQHATFAPWKYHPNTPAGGIQRLFIDSLNYSPADECPYAPEAQRLLLLIYLVGLAFEDLQPTKPILLALGEAGSGKSTMLRCIGLMLFGPEFNVNPPNKDKEDDFWVAVTNRYYVSLDNVDQDMPGWFEEALAMASTGITKTKRILYETNEEGYFKARCFLSLTAHSPKFRRTDVSQRLLILHLNELPKKAADNEMQKRVTATRELLLSEYVDLLNRVLAVPLLMGFETHLRMADFARVGTRTATALGQVPLWKQAIDQIIAAQRQFATEENPLYNALGIWLDEKSPKDPLIANNGRLVKAPELFAELSAIAKRAGLPWVYSAPNHFGREIKRMRDAMSKDFVIVHVHHNDGNGWRISRRSAG